MSLGSRFHSILRLDLTSSSLVWIWQFAMTPPMTELGGAPVSSKEILGRNPIVIDYMPVNEALYEWHTGYGFTSHFGVLSDRSPVPETLPLMTVYYRLIGVPGEH